MAKQSDVHLSRDGEVTSRNFTHLGYDRLITGVYGHATPLRDVDERARRRAELIDRARAIIAVYGNKGVALYGPTALQLLQVALPNRLEDWNNCHVLVPPDVARPRRSGVVAHRGNRPFKIQYRVAGLPLLHPAEHWLQLPEATVDELVEVGDGLCRRRNPLTTLGDLCAQANGHTGCAGSKNIRRALKDVTPGTDSIMETRTRLVLVRAGLPKPEVNLAVTCRASGRTFHVDMGYEMEQVAVEYDGQVHVGDRHQMEIDANRRRQLQDENWVVIPVTAAGLAEPDDIVRSVESALILRRARMARRR